MIRAAFFDLDETLINAEHAHRTATEKAFAHFGYDYAQVKKMSPNHVSMGKRVIDNLRARRDGAGITEIQMPLDELVAVRQRYFLESAATETILLSGAREALGFAKGYGCVVAIVSSGTKEYLKMETDMFGFGAYVDFIVTGDDVAMGKPSPECYVKAYTRAKRIIPDLQPSECLVFEDTEAGVTAGKKAGMKVVYIPTPSSVSPKECLPDFTLSSLLDVSGSQFS